ncbi:hypothetical protein Psi02_30980 [Planotetraspora silvatica]|uniref:Knr4/Smi1-like domain-containing protein n=1 Tax=Planotetraspora silvatica TaxID=234614 RepID=A0A8J3UJ39_9ACTN|nr:hypothetical protein Psi02_30980 [Planotetraspora silvatica]
MTTIDRLVRLAAPPKSPVDAGEDWAVAEAELGLELPSDFKELVRRYGVGNFCDYLFTHPMRSLIDSNLELLEANRLDRVEYPSWYRYPLYPEPGGLLLWGATSSGDRLCWLTGGHPDSWPVVVWNPRDPEFLPQDVGVVEFIEAGVSGRTELFFDEDEEDKTAWFEPYRELAEVYVRLADGEFTYLDRLRILREALAPTANRGSVETLDGHRQDHFAATEALWNVTYETMYGHQIRIAFPPDDEDKVRIKIMAAVESMGCRVLSASRADGAPVWVVGTT